jgi:hypothetical protein
MEPTSSLKSFNNVELEVIAKSQNHPTVVNAKYQSWTGINFWTCEIGHGEGFFFPHTWQLLVLGTRVICKVTLSLGLLSTPIFQWYPQSKEFY